MAIENLKENLILALLIFNIDLWLYITSKKKRKKKKEKGRPAHF